MLVIEYRIVSIDYFMDQLRPWEVSNILESLDCCYRTQWEQTRMLMYTIAQVNSTKQLQITDMLKFAWEKTEDETYISDNDIKRLKAKAEAIAKNGLLNVQH